MDRAEQPTILKRDALGRVSMSRELRETLLDEFERSGLKGAQFARTTGLSYPTFANWVQKRRHGRGDYERRRGTGAQPQGAALRLLEAVVAGVPVAGADAAGALEVLLPGGAKALVGSAHQALLAAELIQALAKSC